jgi:hypothetical protein
MRPLPYDYTRCQPTVPGPRCENCRRWAAHPEQTHNPRGQSYVRVQGPGDAACIYIPDSYLEEER